MRKHETEEKSGWVPYFRISTFFIHSYHGCQVQGPTCTIIKCPLLFSTFCITSILPYTPLSNPISIQASVRANMPLNNLPVEILLTIFESPSLELIDHIRVSETCQRWRTITSTFNTLQERLWKLPSRAYKPRLTADNTQYGLTLNVKLRPVPATIWNGFNEDLWEMTWAQDEELSTIPFPKNTMIENLETYLDIVSQNFIAQPPYEGCGIRLPSHGKRSLIFQGFQDLREKTKAPQNHDCPTESWRDMLISQYPIKNFDIQFYVDIHFAAWNWIGSTCIPWKVDRKDNGRDLKMNDFVGGLQEGLQDVLSRISRTFERKRLR
jgi:hypothetical protein